MERRYLILTIPLLALLSSCAGLEVKSLPTPADDENARGIRYYESAPYLLVHTDNQGGLVTRILYLPDPNKKMSIRPYSKLASGKTTLEFTNGVLTNSEATADATVVPKAILSALEKVATAAIAAALEPETEEVRNVPPPYLFKIVVQGNSVQLNGGEGLGPDGKAITIKVTLPKEQ